MQPGQRVVVTTKEYPPPTNPPSAQPMVPTEVKQAGAVVTSTNESALVQLDTGTQMWVGYAQLSAEPTPAPTPTPEVP